MALIFPHANSIKLNHIRRIEEHLLIRFHNNLYGQRLIKCIKKTVNSWSSSDCRFLKGWARMVCPIIKKFKGRKQNSLRYHFYCDSEGAKQFTVIGHAPSEVRQIGY